MRAWEITFPSRHLEEHSVALQEHQYASRISKVVDSTFASGIGNMLRGWARYAEAYYERFDSFIGDDGVLGPEWESIARSLLGLLNGETGGFDCGSLDHNIRTFARQHGVELD